MRVDNVASAEAMREVLAATAAALRANQASQFVAVFDSSVVKFDLAPPLQESGAAVCDPGRLCAIRLACSGGWTPGTARSADHARAQLGAFLPGRLGQASTRPATVTC